MKKFIGAIVCIFMLCNRSFSANLEPTRYITPTDTTKYFEKVPVRELNKDFLFKKFPWMSSILEDAIKYFEELYSHHHFNPNYNYEDPKNYCYFVDVRDNDNESDKIVVTLWCSTDGDFPWFPDEGYSAIKNGAKAYLSFNERSFYIREHKEILNVPSTGKIYYLKIGGPPTNDGPELGWEIKDGTIIQIDPYGIIY